MDPLPALAAVEAEEDVVVLFAVESGSRAWGFPSPDSDWDVRFIYARPTQWHLRLQPGRDVIERALPGDLDLAGWDMRKTLDLILRGNCAVREWLASPIVYLARDPFPALLRGLVAQVPGREAAVHHYVALAEQVRSRWLKPELLHPGPVKLKKYLYAIRPALTLRWLRLNAEGVPPMDLATLLRGVTLAPAEQDQLAALLARKAQLSELGEGDRLPALDALIASEVALAQDSAQRARRSPTTPALAGLAQSILDQATTCADRGRAVRSA